MGNFNGLFGSHRLLFSSARQMRQGLFSQDALLDWFAQRAATAFARSAEIEEQRRQEHRNGHQYRPGTHFSGLYNQNARKERRGKPGKPKQGGEKREDKKESSGAQGNA